MCSLKSKMGQRTTRTPIPGLPGVALISNKQHKGTTFALEVTRDDCVDFTLDLSGSDCEVVARLLQTGMGPSKICDLLDGVYAFVAYNEVKRTLVAARDPFGVRSLYIATSHGGFGPRLAIASEFKTLIAGGAQHIAPFPPGKLFHYDVETGNERWQQHHVGFETRFFPLFNGIDDAEAMRRLRTKLVEAVRKRVTCDRLPIGAAASGTVEPSAGAAPFAPRAHESLPQQLRSLVESLLCLLLA